MTRLDPLAALAARVAASAHAVYLHQPEGVGLRALAGAVADDAARLRDGLTELAADAAGGVADAHMVAAELRKAAERVVSDPPLCRCDKPGCRFHSAVTVARAYLALLGPPTDPLPGEDARQYVARQIADAADVIDGSLADLAAARDEADAAAATVDLSPAGPLAAWQLERAKNGD